MSDEEQPEAPARRRTCTIDRYCTTLEERITGHNPSKTPGFAVGTIMNFGPGEPGRVVAPVWFIAPKSAGLAEEERGLYLNFCPWCGYDMAPRLERFEAELAALGKSDAAKDQAQSVAPEKKIKRARGA